MKRALIFAAYAIIAVADAAAAQNWFSPEPMPQQQAPALKAIGAKPAPLALPKPERPPDTVIIKYGQGGRLDAHVMKYAGYKREKTKVEVRGPCYSACTMLTAYIPKADLCIAEGAFFAFHAARSLETGVIMPADTAMMYYLQPEDIRNWIDRNGGTQKLPLNGFWTLYDREMWAMGYPKCN